MIIIISLCPWYIRTHAHVLKYYNSNVSVCVCVCWKKSHYNRYKTRFAYLVMCLYVYDTIAPGVFYWPEKTRSSIYLYVYIYACVRTLHTFLSLPFGFFFIPFDETVSKVCVRI